MSRAIFNIFNKFSSISNLKKIPIEFKINTLCVLFGCHLFYAVGTKEERQITISKKYKFNRNGFTEFMVIDNNGRHYNVNNSLWYYKWDSIEDWHLLEENKSLDITYYGLRIPLFGMFPNIVTSKYKNSIKEKDPFKISLTIQQDMSDGHFTN